MDAILGMQLLVTLEWVHSHYKGLIMKFLVENVAHELRGEWELPRSSIPYNRLKKELKTANLLVVELIYIEVEPPRVENH